MSIEFRDGRWTLVFDRSRGDARSVDVGVLVEFEQHAEWGEVSIPWEVWTDIVAAMEREA